MSGKDTTKNNTLVNNRQKNKHLVFFLSIFTEKSTYT